MGLTISWTPQSAGCGKSWSAADRADLRRGLVSYGRLVGWETAARGVESLQAASEVALLHMEQWLAMNPEARPRTYQGPSSLVVELALRSPP